MKKKPSWNPTVDAVAFVLLLFLGATGAMIHFILPPGSGHFKAVWGLSRHQWGDVHYYLAMCFVATLIVHFYLHWSWIIRTIRGRELEHFSLRAAFVATVLFCLVCLAMAPLLCQVGPAEQCDVPPQCPAAQQANNTTPNKAANRVAVPATAGAENAASTEAGQKSPTINGQMTLQEVERATGVPAATILKQLNLPANTPTDERLGRLRKQYNFDMHQLRDIVEKHAGRHQP